MAKGRATVDEPQLSNTYQELRDLSGFDIEAEPVEVRRNVTISIRFSEEEITLLRDRAERAGGKVTAYIRMAALQDAAPVDKEALRRVLQKAAEDVAKAEQLLSERG